LSTRIYLVYDASRKPVLSTEISRYKKYYKTIQGKRMAYVDAGEGDPIVFLHGNPTSSYRWRNVMPHLEGKSRLFAADLIAMGDVEKIDNSGADSDSFVEHRKYLSTLLQELGVDENVTLVVHDWGSGLGFHWTHQNPNTVKGIIFMEAIVCPVTRWEAFPETVNDTFKGLLSPAGEQMLLQGNMFVERMLPRPVMWLLSDTEMAEYRRPYLAAGENHRPTLVWPQQIALARDRADVYAIVCEYAAWVDQNDIPKLFVRAEPGAPNRGPPLNLILTWPNLSDVSVAAIHFLKEASPDEVGEAIAVSLAKQNHHKL
jgi:haloalkane dehalogenase